MSLLESLSKAGASTAAIIIWSLTAILMIGAVTEARKFVVSRDSLAVESVVAPPTIEVKDVPVSEEEYKRLAEAVKQMHPSLRISFDLSNKAIVTEASDLAAYYEWLISIYDIMTVLPNAKWSTVSMCAGEGCQGAKYRIVLTATRRDIEVKKSGP
jgi:hypothetical protein